MNYMANTAKKSNNLNGKKDGDYYARLFKLHHCIGNKHFAAQVAQIQADTLKDFLLTKEEKKKIA